MRNLVDGTVNNYLLQYIRFNGDNKRVTMFLHAIKEGFCLYNIVRAICLLFSLNQPMTVHFETDEKMGGKDVKNPLF